MREFRITLANRPGELARMAQGLSRQGVSLKSVCASADGNQVTVHLIGHDVELTRLGLGQCGVQFSEQEIVQVILEDRAGELANVAAQLSDAGINIDAIYLTGREDDMVEFAIATDDVKKAKKLLK